MLYTLVRIAHDKICCKGDETPLKAAKKLALEEFHNWYPNEAVIGTTVIEIDSIRKELLIKIVWG